MPGDRHADFPQRLLGLHGEGLPLAGGETGAHGLDPELIERLQGDTEPAGEALALQIAWAMGERMVLPWQTKTNRRRRESRKTGRTRWHTWGLKVSQTSEPTARP